MKRTLLCLLGFSLPLSALADRIIRSEGRATWHGKKIYTEKIELRTDDKGRALSTVTTYVDPDGKTLAVMTADFSDGLNVPNHHFFDERSRHSYGIRRSEDKKIVMYEKGKDKPEKTAEVADDYKPDHLKLAGPGLAYYLKDHFSEFESQKNVPILLMIPGNLDTYKFKVRLQREFDGIAEFDVVIESWFLRLFAPRIRFKYDTKHQRILHYEGISNVKDNDDQMQKVTIDYFYDTDLAPPADSQSKQNSKAENK